MMLSPPLMTDIQYRRQSYPRLQRPREAYAKRGLGGKKWGEGKKNVRVTTLGTGAPRTLPGSLGRMKVPPTLATCDP